MDDIKFNNYDIIKRLVGRDNDPALAEIYKIIEHNEISFYMDEDITVPRHKIFDPNGFLPVILHKANKMSMQLHPEAGSYWKADWVDGVEVNGPGTIFGFRSYFEPLNEELPSLSERVVLLTEAFIGGNGKPLEPYMNIDITTDIAAFRQQVVEPTLMFLSEHSDELSSSPPSK